MQYAMLFLNALVDLSNAMAPYILFGLLFAGVLHEIVPDTLVTKHLGKSSILSVVKATLFGVPLPVCSCGVVPLATSIKKSGASNGSTLAFLISTPITGVDSILATYGMFGWAFTIYRVVTSMVISMIAGVLANFYGEKGEKPKPTFSMAPSSKQSTGFNFAASPLQKKPAAQIVRKKFSLKRALVYSFGTLLKDIASPLLIGLLLGSIITSFVPQNLSEILITHSWLSYLIAIAIAIPMYVCATASLPIAAGLMLAGVSPGAAFVFLTAGPATNTVTIGVVKKMLGVKTLYVYLGTIIIGSILFGFGLDYMLKDVSVKEMIHMHEEAGIIAWSSTIVLWSFVLYYTIKPHMASK